MADQSWYATTPIPMLLSRSLGVALATRSTAYALTRDYEKDEAIRVLRTVRAFVTIVHPTDEDYAEASMLRIELRKQGRNLSLIDALSYILAKRLGIPFLTGDREFRDLEIVKYVK